MFGEYQSRNAMASWRSRSVIAHQSSRSCRAAVRPLAVVPPTPPMARTGWNVDGAPTGAPAAAAAAAASRASRCASSLPMMVSPFAPSHGSHQGQVTHLGSSWPGAAERRPIRYEDSRGDLGGLLDTQLLIYSYKKR